MNQRLVFQIRGVRQDDAGNFQPIVLGHIGRATNEEQVASDGKWWTYGGFRKSLELYNLDLLVLEDSAREQTEASGRIIIVEGCFDVAKLWTAGIHNVVATLGSRVSDVQVERLQFLSDELSISHFLFFYDRDEAGAKGFEGAQKTLDAVGLDATSFDWSQTWKSKGRGQIPIPPVIHDPSDFSVEQLQWLRREGLI